MKQIFAFENIEEYKVYEDIMIRFNKKLNEYQKILENGYRLVDLPKGILWTNEELALTVFSDVPIPAYTNKKLIYMCPDIETWRKILIRQLDGKELPSIQRFYEDFSENQVFIILAHELTHHLDLFLDDFEDEREDSIWFEEGMCFYLPRKILLSKEEFDEITVTEMKLVEAFKDIYGKHSLDDFGSNSYQGSLSSIMFDYWRSFLAVKHLVEMQANHDVKSVFDKYHKWDQEGRKVSLSQYFGLNSFFD